MEKCKYKMPCPTDFHSNCVHSSRMFDTSPTWTMSVGWASSRRPFNHRKSWYRLRTSNSLASNSLRVVWCEGEWRKQVRELFTEPDWVNLCSDPPYLGHDPVGYVCLNSRHQTLWVIDCDKNIFGVSVSLLFLKLVLVDHWSRGGLHGRVERAPLCESRTLHKTSGHVRDQQHKYLDIKQTTSAFNQLDVDWGKKKKS